TGTSEINENQFPVATQNRRHEVCVMFLVELQRLEDRKIKLVILPVSRTRPVHASSGAGALNRVRKRLSKARRQAIRTEVEKGLGFIGDIPFVACCFARCCRT